MHKHNTHATCKPTCIPAQVTQFKKNFQSKEKRKRVTRIPTHKSPSPTDRRSSMQREKVYTSMTAAACSVRRVYRSMTAAASREDPTHAIQVPPLRPRGASLEPPPKRTPPLPRFASATSARLAAQIRSTTSRSAHSGRTRLIVVIDLPGRLLLPSRNGNLCVVAVDLWWSGFFFPQSRLSWPGARPPGGFMRDLRS